MPKSNHTPLVDRASEAPGGPRRPDHPGTSPQGTEAEMESQSSAVLRAIVGGFNAINPKVGAQVDADLRKIFGG